MNNMLKMFKPEQKAYMETDATHIAQILLNHSDEDRIKVLNLARKIVGEEMRKEANLYLRQKRKIISEIEPPKP